MVSRWSYPSRTISPWLIEVVHGVPVKVTLLKPANGLSSVSASGVQVPAMSVDVHDRKYRPCAPIASTSSRYWSVPSTLYTLLASKTANRLGSDSAIWVLPNPLGKSASLVCDRYRWPLSSDENR